MTSIMWFRRDLRLADNVALSAAAADGPVVGLFIVDPHLLASVGPPRASYLVATLNEFVTRIPQITLREGDPTMALREVCREVGATQVFATAEYAPRGRHRDEAVAEALRADGIIVHFLDSNYVVVPGTVKTKTGTSPKVFTPFRRGWELEPRPATLPTPSVDWVALDGVAPSRIKELAGRKIPNYFGELATTMPQIGTSFGEPAALEALNAFTPRVANYDEDRNIPGIEGTSRLSPHLRFGTVHPRTVLAHTDGDTRGSEVFRSEIAWREFYADVLWNNPSSTWEPLQPRMADLRIDTGEEALARFARWAVGETGYPIVDAGMRQLRAEGWMHNRVRMITASFLVKHLHLDWHWGASWFMWHLIDGDVASNQHGWQWVAGTGTDASPFHRIFNPTLQAERFDPTGAYVHRWVPELRGVAAPECLQPGGGEGLLAPAGYLSPMIDAATERDEALRRLAELKEQA